MTEAQGLELGSDSEPLDWALHGRQAGQSQAEVAAAGTSSQSRGGAEGGSLRLAQKLGIIMYL